MKPELKESGPQTGDQQMSDSWPQSGPGAISRYRAVVVAALRVKQLRRGSKPRIELDDKKHKHTRIAMEEVRRGLIGFTQSALAPVHDPQGMEDLKADLEKSALVVGSQQDAVDSFKTDGGL